jgi:hypothetical protein
MRRVLVDNIMAALEHRDRVSEITLDGPSFVLERFVAVMREPFPALTHLRLSSSTCQWGALVLPDTFLGGRSFTSMGVSFPAFPKLISSSSQLDTLRLRDIPDAGYISPAEMATCLARLPNLEVLSIGFRSPSPSDRTNPPPPTRVVLPTLNYFVFEGDRKYLEDFVARTDTPLLDSPISISQFPMTPSSTFPSSTSLFVARKGSSRSIEQRCCFTVRIHGVRRALGSPSEWSDSTHRSARRGVSGLYFYWTLPYLLQHATLVRQ